MSRLEWERRDSWIGVFDILGFKNIIRNADQEFPRALLSSRLGELLHELETAVGEVPGLKFQIISDTIVLIAHDLRAVSYGSFLRVCKNLMYDSILKRLPLQGAITAGASFIAEGHPVLIGPAFVEAFEHCEAQDWIGLVMTSSAVQRLRAEGLDPLRHDFVPADVPWRNRRSPDGRYDKLLAYRFQNGSASFESPLLSPLQEMQSNAPEGARAKYDRTIALIKAHYRYF